MSDHPWEEQGQKAHKGLEPLRFLIGEWRGVGQNHGADVHGRMTVEPILDGTWLRSTEYITEEASGTETMDLAFYRYNVKAESLQIFQLYEHAHLSTLLVEPTKSGFRWITGPLAPQLVFTRTKKGFEYCAAEEGQDTPSAQMSYTPA